MPRTHLKVRHVVEEMPLQMRRMQTKGGAQPNHRATPGQIPSNVTPGTDARDEYGGVGHRFNLLAARVSILG
eukprot:m.537351 g.537351  ORF g.537351 m.537351 type:complete len:72 (-) comp22076_c0_seq3:1934-2149(-)